MATCVYRITDNIPNIALTLILWPQQPVKLKKYLSYYYLLCIYDVLMTVHSLPWPQQPVKPHKLTFILLSEFKQHDELPWNTEDQK